MYIELVPGAGIEPARLAAGDFESPASTNFTTRAFKQIALEEPRAWQKERYYTLLEKPRIDPIIIKISSERHPPPR